ncbi:MAG: hypothetical protein IJT70_02645 [Clostridia bacterium]|nr:hypothetical protein [Clostridia bacterium]
MKVLLFGGDARQVSAAEYLGKRGIDVSIYAISGDVLDKYGGAKYRSGSYKGYDAIIFPLPFSVDGIYINCPYSKDKYRIEDVFKTLDIKTKVFAGMTNSFCRSLAMELKLELTDYYDVDELQIRNAVPTAEGAIWTFMNHKEITVQSSNIVVAGCGKVGKSLALRLKALGANVTVTARSRTDLAWAEGEMMNSEPLADFTEKACSCDCIFNTIPHNVFTDGFVNEMSFETLYIELASKPYGMSSDNSKRLGNRCVFAPSLPGKTAPVTAGRIIGNTIYKYL